MNNSLFLLNLGSSVGNLLLKFSNLFLKRSRLFFSIRTVQLLDLFLLSGNLLFILSDLLLVSEEVTLVSKRVNFLLEGVVFLVDILEVVLGLDLKGTLLDFSLFLSLLGSLLQSLDLMVSGLSRGSGSSTLNGLTLIFISLGLGKARGGVG